MDGEHSTLHLVWCGVFSVAYLVTAKEADRIVSRIFLPLYHDGVDGRNDFRELVHSVLGEVR